MKIKKIGFFIVMVTLMGVGATWLSAGTQVEKSFFENSLHSRGEGMRYWYEKDDGFMQITGVPYDALGCKNCHVKTCDACHAAGKDGDMVFSTQKARDMQTCLPCHSREKLGMKFDKKADMEDVHFAAGMECADCHDGRDVHGNGTAYDSMRQPGAITAKCQNCHTKDSEDAPAFDIKIKEHRRHNKNLDCSACHVQSTMACLNCHFGEFLATGQKKGNFIPAKDWTLLINYQGKVTSATAMTFVHRDQKTPEAKAEPFVVYAPYFTHSISAEGRRCNDCHGTEIARTMVGGNPVQMSTYADGKLVGLKGVAPVVPSLLDWAYLDKKEGKWEALPLQKDVKFQMVGYGTPFTQKQLKKLAKPRKTRKRIQKSFE